MATRVFVGILAPVKYLSKLRETFRVVTTSMEKGSPINTENHLIYRKHILNTENQPTSCRPTCIYRKPHMKIGSELTEESVKFIHLVWELAKNCTYFSLNITCPF